MNKAIYFLSISILFPYLTFSSSGESETVYAGDGLYKSTRPLWANAYAPNDEKHTINNVNDLIPGDLFSIGKISTHSTILINGFLSNMETYEKALQVGDRVMVRNERR